VVACTELVYYQVTLSLEYAPNKLVLDFIGLRFKHFTRKPS